MAWAWPYPITFDEKLQAVLAVQNMGRPSTTSVNGLMDISLTITMAAPNAWNADIGKLYPGVPVWNNLSQKRVPL